MVYFTGDIHADLDPERSRIFSRLEADDILIVLGDFGFSWNEMTENLWNAYEFPFTTLTLLGNHENYDRVYDTYPLTGFAGGEAYRVNKNTYYAKNGTMYTIAGERMLCFGGARSIDAVYRTPHVSWWEQEVPSKVDCDRAMTSLRSCRWKFDRLLTHTCSTEEKADLFKFSNDFEDPTERMVQNIVDTVRENGGSFRTHLFGHMHKLRMADYEDYRCIGLYQEVMTPYVSSASKEEVFKGVHA